MEKSCAENAYGWQGVKKDEFGNITEDGFPGHDNYQNGVIPNGSDSTIYSTNWYDGQPGSGYFTDQGTVDSCTHNGVLNSNELGEALQTAPSNYGTNGGDYQHKPNCTAYDIDWDRLDSLKSENPDLYGRLTNPDGMSPDANGIKCAYGKAEANPQYESGQGNQYYIDKDAFNDAKAAGVFKESPDKSFSEEKGNLSREDIPNNASYQNNLASKKNAVMTSEDAKLQPSSDQMNSFEAKQDPDKPYIAQPDSAYGYGRNSENSESSSSLNSSAKSTNVDSDINEINGHPKQQNSDGIQLQSVQSQPTAESSEGYAASQNQPQSGHNSPNQSSGQESGGSSGMSATAAGTDQTASGTGRQSSSDGMSATSANSGQGNNQIQGSSSGMSTTAAGQSSSAPSVSSGQSHSSGQSM